MDVKVNGEIKQVEQGTSLEALLELMQADRRKVAIEVNAAIVPRSLHADTLVQEGDVIEIVEFIGGG